ncbi:nitrogen permease regulator 2 [Polyplosphaeria fusca]|uniref:Nitrogen permease regulator 2 n=1 Tax=Polyplosphaeria fusca TaxID=682080 RepID=A0A9P4R2N9_9PLEO|nr:nitrogen permease regulator 2 [Polyplosphaeria fusca]
MPTRSIKAIFFTRFHHEKGSRVLHQVPEGSITPSSSPSALSNPLLPFSSITSYLIPTQQFCDRLLTFCVNHYRVIGYPVCIREGRYSRNEFRFNFAVVVEEGVADWACYGEVVRKLGGLLRGLEEQGGFLSREEEGIWEDDAEGLEGGVLVGDVGSKVYALCEVVLEDLNNYAECMIPIDESNTINLKLFPTHAPPPPIHPHHVPLLTISLSSLTTPLSSDLTLTRIVPFINGIHSVSHISLLADTDLSLTRKAVQHLVYYGCVVLLDIFSFSAIYAPTAEIGGFITDVRAQEECARYVRVPRMLDRRQVKMGSESEKSRDRSSHSSHTSRDSEPDVEHERKHSDAPSISTASISSVSEHAGQEHRKSATEVDMEQGKISPETLIMLYTSLRQGLHLRSWVLENLAQLNGIDIRRLITFGVIKGFLYRVHKYAVSPSVVNPLATMTSTTPTRPSDQVTLRGAPPTTAMAPRLSHKPSIASTAVTMPKAEEVARLESIASEDREALPLVRFLDGVHSFDEICTELRMSEKDVEAKVRGAGEVQLLFR